MEQKNRMLDLVCEFALKQMSAKEKLLEIEVDYLLRNVIDKPIKGKITKGKLRWRGIDAIVYNYINEPIGIRQRGNIIKFVKHKNK